MYVVVNISPGADMSYVMATLAERALTFSVTDDLSKICARCNTKNSQPLPVPHQQEGPTTSSSSSSKPIEPVPPVPVSREPQQPGPSGTPVLKFKMSPSFTMQHLQQQPKVMQIVQKKPESRKRGEEEMSLSSEPDPQAADDDHQNIFRPQPQLEYQPKKTKESEETRERKVFEEAPPLSPTAAPAIVCDLFRDSLPGPSSAVITGHHHIPPVHKEPFRGECRLCQLPISTRTHHMRRHAMKHLGYKTYICILCQKDFNRSDLCKSHFERYHPNVPSIPFRDTITHEQQLKLEQMQSLCFPEEHKSRGY